MCIVALAHSLPCLRRVGPYAPNAVSCPRIIGVVASVAGTVFSAMAFLATHHPLMFGTTVALGSIAYHLWPRSAPDMPPPLRRVYRAPRPSAPPIDFAPAIYPQPYPLVAPRQYFSPPPAVPQPFFTSRRAAPTPARPPAPTAPQRVNVGDRRQPGLSPYIPTGHSGVRVPVGPKRR